MRILHRLARAHRLSKLDHVLTAQELEEAMRAVQPAPYTGAFCAHCPDCGTALEGEWCPECQAAVSHARVMAEGD